MHEKNKLCYKLQNTLKFGRIHERLRHRIAMLFGKHIKDINIVPKAYKRRTLLLLVYIGIALLFFSVLIITPKRNILWLTEFYKSNIPRFNIITSLLSGFAISIIILVVNHYQQIKSRTEYFWKLLLAARKEGEVNLQALKEFRISIQPIIQLLEIEKDRNSITLEERTQLLTALTSLINATKLVAWEIFAYNYPEELRKMMFDEDERKRIKKMETSADKLKFLLLDIKNAREYVLKNRNKHSLKLSDITETYDALNSYGVD